MGRFLVIDEAADLTESDLVNHHLVHLVMLHLSKDVFGVDLLLVFFNAVLVNENGLQDLVVEDIDVVATGELLLWRNAVLLFQGAAIGGGD